MTAAARGFEALRALAGRRARPSGEARCELCSAEIAPAHRHLVDIASGRLACACDVCLAGVDGTMGGRFRRPSQTVSRIDAFRISEAEWEAFGVPVNLCFFFRSSISGAIEGRYPSPAGAVETTVSESHWLDWARREPALGRLSADVEALLVDRARTPHRYLIVPIEDCYRLVGILRRSWVGWSGGHLLRDEVDRFFASLEARAEVAR